MSIQTGIPWADSTRNFWTGCTKVGPGCDGCYAEAFHRRINGGRNWGLGAPRIPHLDGAACDLRRWNRKAQKEIAAGMRKRWTVFLNSHSDFFDNEVPHAWRDFAWTVIRECRSLTFLIVTKRIGNAQNMLPPDWGPNGYQNVWLLATICDQTEADRDIGKLFAVPAALHGISYEPAIGPVDWRRWLYSRCPCGQVAPCDRHADTPRPRLGWVIVGGESSQGGHMARPFDIGYARDTIRQCKAASVPVFVKQLGSNPLVRDATCSLERAIREGGYRFHDRAGADPSEWPAYLPIRDFPT